MNLYEEILEKVANGYRFNINLQERTINIDKRKYDLNKISRKNYGIGFLDMPEVLDELERLYKEYKYSLPTERSERKKRYFYAVPVEELTVQQMCTGIPREFAQAKLELWLLFNIMNGNFQWTEDMGKWYWHGTDKDLIILKGWC